MTKRKGESQPLDAWWNDEGVNGPYGILQVGPAEAYRKLTEMMG